MGYSHCILGLGGPRRSRPSPVHCSGSNGFSHSLATGRMKPPLQGYHLTVDRPSRRSPGCRPAARASGSCSGPEGHVIEVAGLLPRRGAVHSEVEEDRDLVVGVVQVQRRRRGDRRHGEVEGQRLPAAEATNDGGIANCDTTLAMSRAMMSNLPCFISVSLFRVSTRSMNRLPGTPARSPRATELGRRFAGRSGQPVGRPAPD